jgi:hypothetical protein
MYTIETRSLKSGRVYRRYRCLSCKKIFSSHEELKGDCSGEDGLLDGKKAPSTPVKLNPQSVQENEEFLDEDLELDEESLEDSFLDDDADPSYGVAWEDEGF